MDIEIEDYVKNFYFLRQSKSVVVEEILDIVILIMIEWNDKLQNGSSIEKENCTLASLKLIIYRDFIIESDRKDIFQFARDIVSGFKKQLFKPNYCFYFYCCC